MAGEHSEALAKELVLLAQRNTLLQHEIEQHIARAASNARAHRKLWKENVCLFLQNTVVEECAFLEGLEKVSSDVHAFEHLFEAEEMHDQREDEAGNEPIAIDVLLDGNISELSAGPVPYDAAFLELLAPVLPPQPLFSMEFFSQHGSDSCLTLSSYIAVANCILAVSVCVAQPQL